MNPAWISWDAVGITFGFPKERRCVFADCNTVLRRTNDSDICGAHELSLREAW